MGRLGLLDEECEWGTFIWIQPILVWIYRIKVLIESVLVLIESIHICTKFVLDNEMEKNNIFEPKDPPFICLLGVQMSMYGLLENEYE